MKSKILLVLAISASSAALYAQNGNVGIGTTTPNANALLELNSTSKGLLPPRLTTAQRDAITPKPEGLVIYNTDDHCLQYWNGTQWNGNCSGGSVTPPAPDLTATCTGFRLPYTTSGGNVAFTVSSLPVTATFSAYTNVQTFAADDAFCNAATLNGYQFHLGNNGASSMQINFNRDVSNIKVYVTGSTTGESFTFTCKNGGVTVIPVFTVSPSGTCNGNYSITSGTTTTITANAASPSGLIVNLGSVWFDEIVVTHNLGSQAGNAFNFCVSSAQ